MSMCGWLKLDRALLSRALGHQCSSICPGGITACVSPYSAVRAMTSVAQGGIKLQSVNRVSCLAVRLAETIAYIA